MCRSRFPRRPPNVGGGLDAPRALLPALLAVAPVMWASQDASYHEPTPSQVQWPWAASAQSQPAVWRRVRSSAPTLGLEYFGGIRRSAKCRLGTADNIYPAAVGMDTSLQAGGWHWRVSRPGVARDVVHLVHTQWRDPIPATNGVYLVAGVTCGKTGACRGHSRQSR